MSLLTFLRDFLMSLKSTETTISFEIPLARIFSETAVRYSFSFSTSKASACLVRVKKRINEQPITSKAENELYFAGGTCIFSRKTDFLPTDKPVML